VISPLLANIFMHTVLDDWFVKVVKPLMKGRCFIIRWADDFIIGFEVKSDADRVMEVLSKRFGKYGLSLNMEKTKLIPFMKPTKKYTPGTFDFLGFTFYWGKSLMGKWVLKKQTSAKRRKRFMMALWEWLRNVRHEAIREQYEKLCAKLRGWYQYYGVRGNYEALESVYEFAQKAWRYWLNRRSEKGGTIWKKFKEVLESTFSLPRPRIIHDI
jgi:RNA-directed DNA polymerase